MSERIICYRYTKEKQRNLVPGPQLACRNPEEAIRPADTFAAASSVAGGCWCMNELVGLMLAMRLLSFHAAQTQRFASPLHSAHTLPRHELVGVGGRLAAA